MSAEQAIFTALRGIAADRVYPDFAPERAACPYIVYQQVGGGALNFLDSSAPGTKNARFRISVWAKTRKDAAAVIAQIEAAMRAAAALRTTVLAAPMALADPETRLRGATQDFSVWFEP